ncbi:PspC domain-containing protein [Streptomonospora sediminis]
MPPVSPPADPDRTDRQGSTELLRDNEHGLITGVCAGLGSYTGIDPIVWRMGFAITALAGFTGVLLYVGAWMAMRDPQRGPAMGEQLMNRRIPERTVPALLGLGLAVPAAFSLIGGVGWGTLMLATPLILGVLVAHNRGVDLRQAYRELPGLLKSGEPPPATPDPDPKPAYFNPAQPWAQAPAGPVDLAVVADPDRADSAGGGGDGGDGDAAGAAGHDTAGGARTGLSGFRQRRRERVRDARARRRRQKQEQRAARGVRLVGFVWWLVVAEAAIALGATSTGFAETLFGPQTGPFFLGSVVMTIGVACVAGAWFGDPRGLISTGMVAVLLLAGSALVDLPGMRFTSLDYRPTTVAAAERPHSLTGGEVRLDLTRLPLESGQRVEVGAEVHFGEVTVLVPYDARVQVRGRMSWGRLRIEENVHWGNVDLRRTLEPGEPALPVEPGSGHATAVDEFEQPADQGRGAGSGEGPESGQDGPPPTLVINLASHIGDMEVHREPS